MTFGEALIWTWVALALGSCLVMMLWFAFVPRKHRHMKPLRPNTRRIGSEPGRWEDWT